MNDAHYQNEARKRLRSLFQFLKEVDTIRNEPKTHMEGYPWKLDFSELPITDGIRLNGRYQVINDLFGVGEQADESMILRISSTFQLQQRFLGEVPLMR